MCAIDPEVCKEYFSKDILTPLSVMLPQVNRYRPTYQFFYLCNFHFRFLRLLISFLRMHLLLILLIKIKDPLFGMLLRTLFISFGV